MFLWPTGGGNGEAEETAKTGQGTMASKEKQAVKKNLDMENAQQENEGRDQAPMQNGEEPHHLGGAKARSVEVSGWGGLGDLSLISNGPYLTGMLIIMK